MNQPFYIRSFSVTFLVPIGQRSVTISDETIDFKSTSDSLSRYFFCQWRLKTFFGSKMIEIEKKKKKKGKRFNSFVFSLFQQSSGLQSFCQKLKRWKYNFQLPITLSIQNFLALSLSLRLSYTLTHSLSLTPTNSLSLSLSHTNPCQSFKTRRPILSETFHRIAQLLRKPETFWKLEF